MKPRISLGLTVGLILALVFAVISAFGETPRSDKNPEQVKKHHLAKKHHSKGKKAVVKKKASGQRAKTSAGETTKLQTDINFNDSVLHGRYQTPDEATARVENEKSLADLLAVRTQFKDRLNKASEQN